MEFNIWAVSMLLSWAVVSPVAIYAAWRLGRKSMQEARDRAVESFHREYKLHMGDHELIDAMTGIKGSYMWRPSMLRAYGLDRRGS